MELDEILPFLRCPEGGGQLAREDRALVGARRYPFVRGVPDLRVAPARVSFEAPWVDPWPLLDGLCLEAPAASPGAALPARMHPEHAAALGSPGRLLEIGCGAREVERWAAGHGFEYVGVDVDHRGLGPSLLADAQNLPFVDASFDRVLSLAVYQHVPAPLLMTQEAFRVLRPGGRFVASAAYVYGVTDRASFFQASHAGLALMLSWCGFEIERIWADWSYADSIATMGFMRPGGGPWRAGTKRALEALEGSFRLASAVARRIGGKDALDLARRDVETAGSLSFAAVKPR